MVQLAHLYVNLLALESVAVIFLETFPIQNIQVIITREGTLHYLSGTFYCLYTVMSYDELVAKKSHVMSYLVINCTQFIT